MEGRWGVGSGWEMCFMFIFTALQNELFASRVASLGDVWGAIVSECIEKCVEEGCEVELEQNNRVIETETRSTVHYLII